MKKNQQYYTCRLIIANSHLPLKTSGSEAQSDEEVKKPGSEKPYFGLRTPKQYSLFDNAYPLRYPSNLNCHKIKA